MRLRALTTLNFRNLTPDTLELPAGLVSVSGANGAGKTNLLEAAYLVLTGLTEAGRLEQLVARGSGEAYVRADLERQDGVSILEVGLGRGAASPRWTECASGAGPCRRAARCGSARRTAS